MGELTKEQELRKSYLFFKAKLTADEEHELLELLGKNASEREIGNEK